ncbi:CDP-glycerol glycerophosphotransferase family protein [Brachybacterium sp. Z12]|uniref:CDP-glycerol glycerophosphotransferase family protein n=1 Tax=Brachybacterium sp. Z12 TaxID=2759167 RepID=UPI00223C4E6F|nr:CDP-glycerol glycerophosphotransferase family protein [Brachybacterium sp. Z12]
MGRPSLDTDRTEVAPRAHLRLTVLYAPTWEGGQASAAYSSLCTHGARMVRSLLDAGLDVIYRPHPLTGVRVPEFGEADAELRQLVEAAGGLVSADRSIPQDFAEADLILCDISAIANEWLPTGKPLIITNPSDPHTRDAATALLDTVPRLAESDSGRTGAIAREEIEHDALREQRLELVEYYLGDIAPGRSLERFLAACRRLSSKRDELWERLQSNDAQPPGNLT